MYRAKEGRSQAPEKETPKKGSGEGARSPHLGKPTSADCCSGLQWWWWGTSAAPGAQEGSVSVVNATGPSWGVRSGCFRACRTLEGPAPIEKRAVCNCLQDPLITDASRAENRRASPEVPNLAASEPLQGHVKHTGVRGEGLHVTLPNW